MLDDALDPHAACFNVAEEIYDVIEQHKAVEESPPPKREGLGFNEIRIGKKYRLRNIPSIKPTFRNAEVEIVKKNRTRVVGKLTHAIGGYNQGFSLIIYPENLKEI